MATVSILALRLLRSLRFVCCVADVSATDVAFFGTISIRRPRDVAVTDNLS